MQGRVEVTQGTAFDAGSVTVVEQGGWHALDQLQQVVFVQGDIQVDYAAGLRRGPTRSQLQPGADDTVVVGDNVAFKSHGYRFYTTSNKGFAAVVNWTAKDGSVEQGAIHFPSYPMYDWKQQNQWQAPSGEQLAFRLMIDTALEPDREWRLQGVDDGILAVSLPGGSERLLKAGESIELEHGLLEFKAVRMWMGYKIFYDPLLAWFFAAALVGVVGLAWHYSLKLASPAKTRSLTGHTTGGGHAASATQS
jgi:cytochrome c biogenesis protein